MAEQERISGTKSKEAALAYDQLSVEQKAGGHKLLDICGVNKGDKVLDLGCGTGYLATVLSERVGAEGKVVAVDPDAERIKIAKEKNTKANIECLVENDQTFPGDEYNLVFCNLVIQRIPNKPALFNRLYETLRSGGKFAFYTFDGTPVFPLDMTNALITFGGPDFWPILMYKQQKFETTSAHRQLAESVGFTVTHVENKEETYVYPNLEEMVTYFHGASHGLFDISKVSKDDLEQYKTKNNCGSFSVVHNALYFVVTKP